MTAGLDDRVLVLMPTVRDGERTGRILDDAGIPCTICTSLESLCAEISLGAGAALLTEEDVTGDCTGHLSISLGSQPAWSDFPLVILARKKSSGSHIRETMHAALVERPVKVRSLLSVVRAALRARRHQYAVRDHLANRKITEDRLRESEERFRLMADSVPVLVWVSDRSKRYTWFNKLWLDFTGRPISELVDGGLESHVHRDDLDRWQHSYRSSFEARRPFSLEYRLRRNDGDFRWVTDTGIPRFDGEGKFAGFIGTCVDFTDRKKAEGSLAKLAEDLSQADQRKDEFLSILAHELRNPLAPIRTGLQLMEYAGGDERVSIETISMMKRQINQLVRLVDDLMDVSRITRGSVELRLEQVSLDSIIKSAVETSRPLLNQMGHDLNISLPSPSVILNADPTRLAQAFMNLLNNAAKYSEPGGSIQIAAAVEQRQVLVSVRDTGIGIPSDKLTSIFEMFSQVDRTLENARGGLGIGLTLVKRLVEMHGGNIEVKSDGIGKGSEFIVRLPVIEEVYTQTPQVVSEGPPKTSLRILVVDDNRDGADTLGMMLRILGNDTRIAYDGQEGVEAAEQFRPDVILFDIGLPRLNGYDACRKVRETSWGKDITIIAVTGWGQEGDRRRSKEAGFDHHIVKPVAPDVVLKLLITVSSSSSSRAV